MELGTQFNQPQQVTNVRIKKLYLVETGGYKDQFIRSFEINATHEHLNKIEEVVYQKQQMNSTVVSPVDISMAAPDLMLPSQYVIGKVDLPYGWQEKRFRFLLEVVEPGAMGSERVTIIQGYTEYPGANINTGSIDERMKFYANSVIELVRTLDPNTGVLTATVIRHYNIVHLPTGNVEIHDVTQQHNTMPYGMPQPTLMALRPEDMISAVTSMYSMDLSAGEIVPSGILIKPVDANKNLSIPTMHIANTLTGVMKANKMAQITYDKMDILGTNLSLVKTNGRDKNNFWKLISSLYGYAEVNTFTFGDLKQIDANVDNVTSVFASQPGAMLNNPVVQQFGTDSEEFYKPTIEARMAVLVSEAITSLMANNLLSKVTLTFSNQTGEPIASILKARTMIDGINVANYGEKLRIEFENFVGPVITMGNEVIVNLLVDSDITGDTVVAISYNNNPEVVFRIPTFADSTFNPLIETKQGFTQNVEKFKDILDTADIILSNGY